jgi:rare lipoprotein A
MGSRPLAGIGAVTAALALPALGLAASRGGNPSGGGGMGPSDQTQTQSGRAMVSDSANGITIVTHASGFLNRQMTFTGRASRSNAGRTVEIQRYGHATKDQWVNTASATIGAKGRFTAHWQASGPGGYAVRAVLSGRGGHAASAWPMVKVIVYKMAIATVYGGPWGSTTACGEKLHRSTIGVANRTLPCGTKVSIYFKGRTMVVPVIDRGPYANHADWDLTTATARAMHMNGTENIGAAAISHHH